METDTTAPGAGPSPSFAPPASPRPPLRLGLALVPAASGEALDEQLVLAVEADRLGYDVCWAPEAYGTDAVSVLSVLAARTSSIGLGSGVMQIPARAPTMTAMTAATLDRLSGGRFRLGLGLSGPQVSEGWYGVGFGKPLRRTREYVEVVRAVLARERVEYAGRTLTLPLPSDAERSIGGGKALKLGFRAERADLPIYLAAVGPANLKLAGEIADGWLGVFVAADVLPDTLASIEAGRAARAAGGGFDAVATLPVVLGDDLERCAEQVAPYAALYLGGMGSREHNFYHALAVRMGYGDAAAVVQDHFLAGRYREAAAAVPSEFVDSTSLLGPPSRIRDRLTEYAAAGLTTASVLPMAWAPEDRVAAVRAMPALLDR